MRNTAKRHKILISRRARVFFLVSLLAAIPAFVFRGESGILMGFGNYLLVFAAGYWGIAWFSWLKQDGLAILNPGHLGKFFRSHADEWKERIPLPHEMVSPENDPAPLGDSPAEQRLKARIEARRLSVDLALAGLGSFLVSILFQYGIARLFVL